jgi:tRNA-specific 2-thiouridylase
MGQGTDGRRRFVTAVDVPARRVRVGPPEAALTGSVDLHTVTWVDGTWVDGTWVDGDPPGHDALAQASAHGRPTPVTLVPSPEGLTVRFATPQRRIAPGQTVALYHPDHPDVVVGSGIAA